MAYCVVDRPGYFGEEQATVYSAHRTLKAARRAKGKNKSVCIVEAEKSKGAIVWGDMFPHIIEDNEDN